MMKVTVKDKNLNVRAGKPSVNAPCYQYIAPGSEIEVDGQLYKGDSYDGIDTWMKDEGGNYYWSGGVNQLIADSKIIQTKQSDIDNFNSIAKFPTELVNWNSRLSKIPFEIRITSGSGVKVGLLDTGFEKTHLDLVQSLIDSKDFTNSANGDLDVQGHGSEMASLIAAVPYFNGKGITGVAPGAKIYSTKVMYDENDPGDFSSVENAIDYLLAQNADIINMSIGRPLVEPTPASISAIANKISKATQTIFFAATKEQEGITNPAELLQLFPASCLDVIAVSSLTKDFVVNHWNDLPAPLIIIPAFDAWCCSVKYRHYYFQDTGSSISTALVSGIAALILSANSTVAKNKKSILAELEKYSSSIEEAFANPGNEIHIILKK